MFVIADVVKTPLDNFSLILKYALRGDDVPVTIFKSSLETKAAAAAIMRKSIEGAGSQALVCYDFERKSFVDPVIISEDMLNVAYSGASEITAIEVIWCIQRLLYGLYDDDHLIVKTGNEIIGTWHCAKSPSEIDDPNYRMKIEKYLDQL